MPLEYKSIPFEIKSLHDDEEDKNFKFEGFASTFGNIDRGDDIIEKGAFIESLKQLAPALLWQHSMSEPIGILTAREVESGLFVKGEMPRDDTFVAGRVMPQMRIGSTRTMSIGFQVLQDEMKKIGDKVVRIIKEAMLFEVSIVTLPMNPLAVVTDIKTVVPFQDLPFPKNADGEIDFTRSWDSSAAISRVREFTNSEDAPSARYKNAFLWYDRADQENFGAYKLPIADIVDGRMMAIPRGIFAAAAALRGARGGVDIPDSQRNGVIANVNRYYAKMDRPSPFDKSFIKFIHDFQNLHDVSAFLKDFGLSNGEATALIHQMKLHLTPKIMDEKAASILAEGIKQVSDIIKVK